MERTPETNGASTNESKIDRDPLSSVVASALSLAGGIVFGYFLFEKTKDASSTALPVAVTGGALVLLGMLLLSRWWIRANRSIAPGAPISAQLKIERGFYLCVSLFAAVGFDYIAYDLSHNRMVEALTALMLTVPMGLFVLPIAFRLSRPFTAFVTSAWKTSIGLQVVIFVTFAINLIVNLLPTKHTYPEIEPLREFNIAMEFMWLALGPFSARLLRKRYREAKAFQAAAPPDRWQAYKNKLASNE